MANAYRSSIGDYMPEKEIEIEKEIKKIDNAIEFFQSTSEEEVQKYLSYKMGDSKKIN